MAKGKPSKHRWLSLVWLGGAAVILALGGVNVGVVGTLTRIVMFMALAAAWNILGGYGGYLNLGMATFLGVGAYGAGIAATHLGTPLLVSALIGALAATLLGFVVGLLSLPLRGAYFAIFTFVSLFILQAVANNISLTNGALGLNLPALPWSLDYQARLWYWLFAILLIGTTYVSYRIQHARFGDALVAIREDEDAAEVLGVRTVRTKLIAFVLGAFVAGAVGGVYAYQLSFIYPSTIFDITVSIEVVLGAAAGGTRSWLGPLVGMPLVMLVSAVLRDAAGELSAFSTGVPPQLEQILYGLLLVAVGLFFRQGVVGWLTSLKGRRRPAETPGPPVAEEGATDL